MVVSDTKASSLICDCNEKQTFWNDGENTIQKCSTTKPQENPELLNNPPATNIANYPILRDDFEASEEGKIIRR